MLGRAVATVGALLGGISMIVGPTWTVGCASSSGGRAESAGASPDEGRCLEGTRFEQRLGGCVADAPDDEGTQAWCTDNEPRPTREIMGEVQDLERQRTAQGEDLAVRRDLSRQLARGYEELGCATSREAELAKARLKALADQDPEEAEKLERLEARARKIQDAAREAAARYRREAR